MLAGAARSFSHVVLGLPLFLDPINPSATDLYRLTVRPGSWFVAFITGRISTHFELELTMCFGNSPNINTLTVTISSI